MVERAIRMVKDKYRKLDVRIAPKKRLALSLYYYRNTATSTTNRFPSELMLGRMARSYMDNNCPDVISSANDASWKQKQRFDKNKQYREFEKGQKIWVKNETNQGYRPATIVDRTGELSYRVADGSRTIRKHSDQIKQRVEQEDDKIIDQEIGNDYVPLGSTEKEEEPILNENHVQEIIEDDKKFQDQSCDTDQPALRRSPRIRKQASHPYFQYITGPCQKKQKGGGEIL
ncbi:hypothetical protein RF11_01357 [Thelohanellus kitauei]|uniref:Integrase catalytic domain-containing protein n=1 Tax=Thelohanellus kitauei TaxID=669202 RepID=A0A0C2JQY7_THEKT|nr:hypothetical protein RF11_01357 [Thelohanellus kitauei]